MNTAFQDTLLQLFQQVTNDPDSMPDIPVNEWQEGSLEWQLLTSFHDMLERTQQRMQEALKAEEQLREKEVQYRSIFEASSDGIFIAALDGFPVEANPAACKMFGYSYDDFIGLDPTTFIHPDYLHLMAEHVQATRAGIQYQSRGVVLRKDGTSFLADAHTTPFVYKGQPHILAVVRDVTEQVQAEEQLREKEAQYRGIFEATIDALCILNLDGFIVEVNPAACSMYGYSYEELLSMKGADIVSPKSLPVVLEGMQTITTGGKLQTMIRADCVRKDGTTYLTEGHATLLMYKGKPHILTVARDVTEQVRAEKQLRENEAQYRSIFEASTDALIINDLVDQEVGRVVEVNPAACKMYGYSYEEFIDLPLSTIVPPDRLSFVMKKALPTIRASREYHVRGVFNLRKDGTAFPIDLHETAFNYQGKLHMLSVVRDITEQMRAEEQLREKEAQYRSIFEKTTNGLAISDLEDGHSVEVNPAMCKMYGYTEEEFLALPPMATLHPDSYHLIEESIQAIKTTGEFHTQAVVLHKDGTPFHIESHATTFMYQGKPHILSVVRDITEQVQAQQLLEQRVEERTRELSTLLEVSHNVASTIELKPLLDLILDQLKVVVDYSGSSVIILEDEDLVLVGTRGPKSEEHLMQRRFPLKQMGIIWEMLCRREPVIIDDVRGDTPLAQAYRETVDELLETTFSYIRSWLAVPLMLKERVIGFLSVSHSEPNYYTLRHAALALAIANQAAVAIENARLYEQAQELAALEERQRLARELHDSVSQALYGISLGAHTARTLLDRDPGKVAEPLSYVLSQAETALTEMRALIFELRPESLETEGLVAALGRQAAALRARHGLEVAMELGDEPDLSLKVKQELYRFAQEALHNTVKHARANRVDMRMHSSPEGFLLEVFDDGVGFDPASAFPGHLGLHSMRERVTRLGGGLQIESAPGHGTRIHLRLPASVPR